MLLDEVRGLETAFLTFLRRTFLSSVTVFLDPESAFLCLLQVECIVYLPDLVQPKGSKEIGDEPHPAEEPPLRHAKEA